MVCRLAAHERDGGGRSDLTRASAKRCPARPATGGPPQGRRLLSGQPGRWPRIQLEPLDRRIRSVDRGQGAALASSALAKHYGYRRRLRPRTAVLLMCQPRQGGLDWTYPPLVIVVLLTVSMLRACNV